MATARPEQVEVAVAGALDNGGSERSAVAVGIDRARWLGALGRRALCAAVGGAGLDAYLLIIAMGFAHFHCHPISDGSDKLTVARWAHELRHHAHELKVAQLDDGLRATPSAPRTPFPPPP